MIDCHAHAFPDLSYHASKLPGPLADAAGMVAPALSSLMSRFSGKSRLSTEKVAAMRKKGPRALHRVTEIAGSLAMAPQVMASGNVQKLLESMDRHGIERTIVIAAPPVASNEWLLDDARVMAGERIVPVTMLPALPAAAAEATWRDAFEALVTAGTEGFKIHPNMDGLPPTHAAYHALFEVARDENRFVILHTGCFNTVVYKHQGEADPREWEPLFEEFPTVRVCLAHMNRDRPDRAWDVMKRHPQLFADTSWQPADAIREAIAAVGADRILLGSDWPLLHGDLQGDAVRALRKGGTSAQAEQIGTASAEAFLG